MFTQKKFTLKSTSKLQRKVFFQIKIKKWLKYKEDNNIINTKGN